MWLEKLNNNEIALGDLGDLSAVRLMDRWPSLTTDSCFLGRPGSSGRAEENDHSSSSNAAAGAGAVGLGVDGLDENCGEASAAKGSFAGVAVF